MKTRTTCPIHAARDALHLLDTGRVSLALVILQTLPTLIAAELQRVEAEALRTVRRRTNVEKATQSSG